MNPINYPSLKRYPCSPEAKMKLFKLFLIFIFISTFFSNNSFAQYEKQAQVGFRFLANPVSAEVMGRGGVGILNTKNSNGIFWNPSLISLGKHDYDIWVTTGEVDKPIGIE